MKVPIDENIEIYTQYEILFISTYQYKSNWQSVQRYSIVFKTVFSFWLLWQSYKQRDIRCWLKMETLFNINI